MVQTIRQCSPSKNSEDNSSHVHDEGRFHAPLSTNRIDLLITNWHYGTKHTFIEEAAHVLQAYYS